MVEIGPTLATIAILEEPINLMPFAIKKEGITVAIMATPTPNKYNHGNASKSNCTCVFD